MGASEAPSDADAGLFTADAGDDVPRPLGRPLGVDDEQHRGDDGEGAGAGEEADAERVVELPFVFVVLVVFLRRSVERARLAVGVDEAETARDLVGARL